MTISSRDSHILLCRYVTLLTYELYEIVYGILRKAGALIMVKAVPRLRVMTTAAEVNVHLLDRRLTYEHNADFVANGW